MRYVALALTLTLVACGTAPSGRDAATPVDALEVELDAGAMDAAPDAAPDAPSIAACADVASACASGQWTCSLCGTVDPSCWCNGQPELWCAPDCAP